jgi:hypothetical protein
LGTLHARGILCEIFAKGYRPEVRSKKTLIQRLPARIKSSFFDGLPALTHQQLKKRPRYVVDKEFVLDQRINRGKTTITDLQSKLEVLELERQHLEPASKRSKHFDDVSSRKSLLDASMVDIKEMMDASP